MHENEKVNARDFPDTFYCRHFEPGLCGYENEKVLIDTDAMKRMCASFNNKPIYVFHQKVDLKNLQQKADGYVTECFYNELDGWLWAKMIIVSDDGKDAISRGWSVSNAYVPTEFASGGQHHNVNYDRKIVNANFTHLAIVPDPRYEGARIYSPEEFKLYNSQKRAQLEELKNSKGATRMFKRLFKNKQEEVTNAEGIDEGTMVELQNGKTVSLKEMIESITKAEELENAKAKKNSDAGAKEEKKDDEESKLNAETEVMVGDKKMPLGHLMNKYQNMQKENEAEEAKKKSEKDEAEEKANSKALADAALEKANFDELKNAKNKGATVVQVDTVQDQLARGKANYGSSK